MHALQDEALARAAAVLSNEAAAAASRLVEIAEDEGVAPSVRLRANHLLLELAARLRWAEIEERLQRVEDQVIEVRWHG